MDIAVVDVIGDFAIALATVALTAVGAWLAHSYRRRMRFELAEARRTAYSALWEISGLAASTRLDMQLSLLRTQLKSDLAIFGQNYTKGLVRHERLFLEECQVDLRSEPWKRVVGSSDRTEGPEPTGEPGQPLVIPRARPAEEPGEDPLRALWRMVESWRRGR
jgi:hypothetical protein